MAADTNFSKDGMLADCEAEGARRGLNAVAIHVDDGLSGAIRDRPEFTTWLVHARELRAANLVPWHVDQITREGINVAAQILDTIEGKHPQTGKVVRQRVRLIDTKGLDSETDETSFRFQFVIKAEMARAERERMRDRNRAARRRATVAGRWAGGPTPFGFRAAPNPDGPGKVLEHDPREVEFIREAAATRSRAPRRDPSLLSEH